MYIEDAPLPFDHAANGLIISLVSFTLCIVSLGSTIKPESAAGLTMTTNPCSVTCVFTEQE